MASNWTPEARAAFCEARIQTSIAYANHWLAFATSETNRNRKVFRGDHQLTPAELEAEAFDTALVHIRRIDELGEARADLIARITRPRPMPVP